MTGVPVATVKYYIREGLLPHGEETGDRSVSYGQGHKHRLELIRTLAETTELTIAQIKEVLDAMARFTGNVHQALAASLAVTHKRIESTVQSDAAPHLAEHAVDRILAAHDWTEFTPPDYRETLVSVLSDYFALGYPEASDITDILADAAEQLAEADLETIDAVGTGTEFTTEWAVSSVLMSETLLSTLRRIAHTAASARHQTGESRPGGRAED